MLNIFYAYGLVWLSILFLYFLGWSSLCTNLDTYLIIFIIFMIISSFIIGFLLRKNLQFRVLKENPHQKTTTTKIFAFLFFLEIVFEWKIPLISVLKGQSYADISFLGIPNFHIIISSLAIFYSFYLAYIYVCFKEKKTLLEFLVILLYFILLMQRQNIMICLVVFMNMIYLNYRSNSKFEIKNKLKNVLLVASVIVLLFFFGAFGNMRYGNKWSWNDSSMIESLGRMTEKYPKFIPKEYFWSYIYLVSPLVNLNHNIKEHIPSNNYLKAFTEYIPDFINNNLFRTEREKILLPVSSLNASTSYVRTYNSIGYIGMYLLFLVQTIFCAFVVVRSNKNNSYMHIVIINALLYFYLFTFFMNTFTYSITCCIALYALFFSSRRFKNEKKK